MARIAATLVCWLVVRSCWAPIRLLFNVLPVASPVWNALLGAADLPMGPLAVGAFWASSVVISVWQALAETPQSARRRLRNCFGRL